MTIRPLQQMMWTSVLGAFLAALPASSIAQSKYIKDANLNSATSNHVINRLKRDYATDQPFSISLRTMVLGDSPSPKNRLIAAELDVGVKGCGGSFTGVGTVVNDRIVLRPYKPRDFDEACTITLEVDKTGESVKVTEKSCSSFHGAACGYSGTLTSKSSGPDR